MEFTLIVITLLSTMLAVAMTVVAWRAARHERLRSEARVAVLAAEIQSADGDLPSEPARVATSADLFVSAQPRPDRSRLATVVVGGALVVGAAVALVIVSSEPDASAPIERGDTAISVRTSAVSSSASASGPLQAAQALELVALGHERHNDRLTVRGVVRNPANGTSLDGLTAVVMVFNGAGALLASGRSVVQASALGPGGESTFVVTVPGVNDVERYRVSFRTDDRIVPHVDVRS